MRNVYMPIAGVCVLALSACGGSDDGGEDFIVSDGLLRLELPPAELQAELAGTDLGDALEEIERVNTTGTVDTTPTGSSQYSGTFGMELDGNGALVSGIANILVRTGATGVDVDFDPTDIDDGSAMPPSISGNFNGDDLTLTDGYYNGALAGSIVVGGSDTYNVTADLRGVFAEGGETIGDLEGSVVNQADPDDNDTFGGLYIATNP